MIASTDTPSTPIRPFGRRHVLTPRAVVPCPRGKATALGAFAVASQGDWEGLPMRNELHLLDAKDAAIR